MISSKEDLLGLCVNELPTEELELNNGVKVKVQALKGSEVSRIFSNQNMDERI